MEQKIHSYENNDITVHYDARRCIHAKECVKGLKSVFDPKKRPWIQPDEASAEQIMEVVERCPTGALHYRLKDDATEEKVPPRNTISISPDGPVYFRGNIEVQNEDGETVLKDTRWALCRCGHSGNKPACDNTHTNIEFEASACFKKSNLEEQEITADGSRLILKALKNGPVLVQGSYVIYSETSQPVSSAKNIALCRCGGSSNKPFCDGTHKEINFTS